MNIIQLINVTKTYKNGVTALHDVSLTLKEGDFISVMGQSGSGKSTLLRMLSGVYEPDGGRVLIDGKNNFENMILKELKKD